MCRPGVACRAEPDVALEGDEVDVAWHRGRALGGPAVDDDDDRVRLLPPQVLQQPTEPAFGAVGDDDGR